MNPDDKTTYEEADLNPADDQSTSDDQMSENTPELDSHEPRFGERIGEPFTSETAADSADTAADASDDDLDEADDDTTTQHTAM